MHIYFNKPPKQPPISFGWEKRRRDRVRQSELSIILPRHFLSHTPFPQKIKNKADLWELPVGRLEGKAKFDYVNDWQLLGKLLCHQHVSFIAMPS